ncbi:hypothetical protein PBRA_007277 [Plasmodiophora brassicae]|uniref:WH1 domain-containing protein n=1 Tax=Plasmodiophora brassicae TaxID=37360 RepID=A0A0G4IWK9_PLABS|nr:hypothetical protein PBRA_007277 [Plasmodiophora brassicae]
MEAVAAALHRDGKDLNLVNLHRLDAGTDSVLYTASYVVLYVLVDMRWERHDTEGSMFWVKRSSMPWSHRLVIVNRLNITNVTEDLDRSMAMEFQKPFAFYRSSNGDVFAIWFSQQTDFDEFQQKWQTFAASKGSSLPPTPIPQQQQRPSLLSATPLRPAATAAPVLISPDFLLKSPSPSVSRLVPNTGRDDVTATPRRKRLNRREFERALRRLVDSDAFVDQLHRLYCSKMPTE